MYQVRKVEYDEAITGLLRECGLPTSDLGQGRHVTFFGAYVDNRLLGCVATANCGDVSLLRSLAVTEHARGAGLGAALVMVAEQYARGLGHRAIYLLTTNASKFFADHGYAMAERSNAPDGIAATAQFSGLCPSSSHFMWKRLQQSGE